MPGSPNRCALCRPGRCVAASACFAAIPNSPLPPSTPSLRASTATLSTAGRGAGVAVASAAQTLADDVVPAPHHKRAVDVDPASDDNDDRHSVPVCPDRARALDIVDLVEEMRHPAPTLQNAPPFHVRFVRGTMRRPPTPAGGLQNSKAQSVSVFEGLFCRTSIVLLLL